MDGSRYHSGEWRQTESDGYDAADENAESKLTKKITSQVAYNEEHFAKSVYMTLKFVENDTERYKVY